MVEDDTQEVGFFLPLEPDYVVFQFVGVSD